MSIDERGNHVAGRRDLSDPAQERGPGAGSEQVREWIKSLQDETPSLAWRSGLNERLLHASRRRRLPSLGRWAALGAAAGVCLALLLFIQTPQGKPSGGVEEGLLATHSEAVSAMELGAATPRQEAGIPITDPGWSTSDLEAL